VQNLSKYIMSPKATSTNSSSGKNNKRKRQRSSPGEQLEIERKERYDKLLYQAKKALHKEAKVVKSFEVQKVVRRIKENQHPDPALDDKLTALKQFPVDSVVQICVKHLGIPNLNPTQELEHEKSTADGDALVEKMLQHKRLGAVMEAWNEKVTEYRRWCLRRKDAVSGVPSFVEDMQPKNMKKAKRHDDLPSMFVSLGGLLDDEVDGVESEDNKYLAYGPASTMEMEIKKNRPGQRQRQAKAKALEARKEGRIVDKSLNWREKKRVDDNDNANMVNMVNTSASTNSKNIKPKGVDAAKIAGMGKTWKEDGKAHPSWAASASQKTGIVAFSGKKITFD
jgi:hypothetical protein